MAIDEYGYTWCMASGLQMGIGYFVYSKNIV